MARRGPTGRFARFRNSSSIGHYTDAGVVENPYYNYRGMFRELEASCGFRDHSEEVMVIAMSPGVHLDPCCAVLAPARLSARVCHGIASDIRSRTSRGPD